MLMVFGAAIVALIILVTALGGSRLSRQLAIYDIEPDGSCAARHLVFLYFMK